MNPVIGIAALCVQLTFGGFIDCEHYSVDECVDDTTCRYKVNADIQCCYVEQSARICRANCSRITWQLGQPGACEVFGCIADDSGYPSGYEGEMDCVDANVTASPTTTARPTGSPTTAQPTTAEPTTSQPTTAEPTQPNDTKAPTKSPITTDEPTTAAPTTSQPTTPEPTRVNSGDGRCAADGTIQEQVFGPGEYQCGDYNLGQPEERCLFIDASSTCTGTEFGQCGDETDPWPTFQSALDSLNGETVVLIVKAGTYSGEGNINIRSPNINNLNEYVYLNIFSESGSDDTIIDCKGEGFGFHLFQTTIRMDGFTIINCVAEERTTFSLPSYASNFYIQSAPNSGRLGGAFFLDRTFITMNDMIIVNNGAEYGGGIFQYQNSIRMNNSIVEYNCATNSGGGIFLLFANLYMWNSYVICNEADVFGGGIFGHQQRTDILENALVDENTAEYADELFCDKTTVNVASESNGAISDNDVDSWNINEVTVCQKNEWGYHTCAFYDEDRSIDFCKPSDSDLIDAASIVSLADDQGSCQVEIMSSAPTQATPGPTTAQPTTAEPTQVGDTRAPTMSPITDEPTTDAPIPQSNANCQKVLAVTFVTMIISLMV